MDFGAYLKLRCTGRLPRRFAPRNDKSVIFTRVNYNLSFQQAGIDGFLTVGSFQIQLTFVAELEEIIAFQQFIEGLGRIGLVEMFGQEPDFFVIGGNGIDGRANGRHTLITRPEDVVEEYILHHPPVAGPPTGLHT